MSNSTVITINKFAPLSYAGSEAINTLCTNLSFSGSNVKRIMFTSCHASEGKSFLTMNTMRTFAKFGKTVCLIDADLRRSVLGSKFALHFSDDNHRMGLAHFLAGMVPEDDVLYETSIKGAWMVPVGRDVSNPLQLLNSPRFGVLLDHLAQKFNYVLVDAPPVGTVIDGAQIAKFCDGTLIVVNYNSVRRQELTEVIEQLEQSGCPILGAALNMVELDNYVSRKYYYRSYYSNYSHYGHYDMPTTDSKRSRKRK